MYAQGTDIHTAPNKRRFPSVYAGTTAALKKTLDFHHTLAVQKFVDVKSTDELDYYIDAGAVIFDYYDQVENNAAAYGANNNVEDAEENNSVKQPLSEDTNKSANGNISLGMGGMSHRSNERPHSIMRYFQSGNQDAATETRESTGDPDALQPDDNDLDVEIKTDVPDARHGKMTDTNNPMCIFRQENRASLLEKYMCRTTPEYMKHASILQSTATSRLDESLTNLCEYCGSYDRTVVINDGMIICNECATAEYVIIDHDRPSYKEPPKEISYFAYKRINHLNEWLNQVQGKETTDIPEEIYDKIFYEIQKRKITNMADITQAQLKNIMRKLHINKYYEHIPHIMYRLNGIPVPVLSSVLEEKIRSMFKQIQVPFLKYSPPNRKNFLSYSYCIHKFLQLLEMDEYLMYFPLLKSREKLQAQDNIWKKICEDINWQFVKSL